MNTYIVDSEKFDCEITFKFNLNGILKSFDIGANLTLEQTQQFTTSVSLIEKEFVAGLIKHKVKYQLIPANISFELFWNTYDYKKGGSKELANKSFNKLSAYDKSAAIDYIKQYKKEKQKQGTALQYAVTYINQRMWNN